jgi:hypothetical protein
VTGPNGKSDQVFLIANPDDVVIQNTGDTDSLTFACGDTLNRPATVYFAPPPATKAAGPLTGTAKRIEFEKKN